MGILKKLFSVYRKDKRDFLYRIVRKLCGAWMPDEMYLKILYRLFIGRPLNLKDPQSYNEKLQWLKIHDHNPLYTIMVDKYAVKKYVSEKVGEKYIIPTLGVWDNPADVDFSILPKSFVLKTTFGGGGNDVVICKNKESLDVEATVKYLNGFMKQDSYRNLREWPYKNVPRRIIAEQYLEETGKDSLTDYKVMCFNGVAKLIELHVGRYTSSHVQEFYDRDWNKTSISQDHYDVSFSETVERPILLDEMLRLSEVLAKDIPHVRVDWYIVNGNLYFGELTFFDGSGLTPWDDYKDDLLMGSWITLPKIMK